MAVDGQVIRPMMYLALSYDHRIVDGKEAVTFLVIKQLLEDPARAPTCKFFLDRAFHAGRPAWATPPEGESAVVPEARRQRAPAGP
jgi:hypothetical protein